MKQRATAVSPREPARHTPPLSMPAGRAFPTNLRPTMKKLHCACLVALAGFMASPAAGQVVIQPPGGVSNPLALVENKDVQADLTLSEEQVKKVADLVRKQADGLKGVLPQEVEKRRK